ncbi:MAG: hypothetical protein FJY53_02330 [Betaproteobacteria bacterium]|nr:hypothetical protein [Betaproteobacteria bacterium]
MRISTTLLSCVLLVCLQSTQAEILPEAQVGIKIPLSKSPTTRPMTVAYMPTLKMYYIADGGLAPMGSEYEVATSKSEVHAYNANGQYINSAKPGYDNRSIYFNPNSGKLETITYNVSSDVGFSPNTGIYALDVSEKGEIKNSSNEISQFNPAFGHAGTMPAYDAEHNRYFAKQGRSNLVFVVDPKLRERIGTIVLDFENAKVAHDEVSDLFIAYTGVAGEELAMLDIDHKAILVFDLNGRYAGKSELPKALKLRSKNHFNGTGFANNMLFVFHEPEGEFGTYYGFKILK